ncbi:MAG: hypothetical protein IID53_05150, partial [Proteobacteria bacterium]|nr:hypothetical protein [Pseudomonadota bacterium]
MVLSVLTYNASSGSDTAASGAGPSTAITGSSATNGAGNIVNLDGTPDLSGVAVNDIIWVNVSGVNINLSRITAVDDGADTVTTEDLTVLGGGVTWAIGGKRKTLENNTSKMDWEDSKAGWRFVFEAGTYSITKDIDPGVGDDTNGPVEFVSSDPGVVLPIFDITTNIRIFNLTVACNIIIDGIKGTRSSGGWPGSVLVRLAVSGNVLQLRR